MGYFPENTPVWIADHPRACVDYLYYAVLKTGTIGRVILEEWFPSDEDKKSVYALINKIEPNLNKNGQICNYGSKRIQSNNFFIMLFILQLIMPTIYF